MRRRIPWPLVVAWLAVGVTGYAAIAAVLDDRSRPLSMTVTVEAVALWAVVWVAMLVPRITTLTSARIGVPCAFVAAAATLVVGEFDPWPVAFLVTSLASLATLANPTVIDSFIDGSSYGPERRFGLRTPPLTALIAVPPTWAIAVAVVVVPPLAATGEWIAALVIFVVWAAGVRWVVRSLHLPARRWVVFVPAGMVLADPLLLVDALLLPRRNITTLGPAYATTDATDLTQGTLGLATQVDLNEVFEIPFRDGRNGERTVATDRAVFSVLRPGALLAEAARRRVTVGETQPEAPTCLHHVEHSQAHDASQTAVPLPKTRSPR